MAEKEAGIPYTKDGRIASLDGVAGGGQLLLPVFFITSIFTRMRL
ncbi:hypothetical protein [Pseudoflavonifractor sp. 524-17]|nr:hypothetical protein [Pseudoflavonifractor sp. 524-17]